MHLNIILKLNLFFFFYVKKNKFYTHTWCKTFTPSCKCDWWI